jgi:hypothetical protein
MTLVGYPSTDFPPPPRFSLSVPDDWQAAWPPGTLLAVYSSPGKEGIEPNVLVAYQRLPGTANFNDALERALEEIRGATPARELEPVRRLEIENIMNAALLSASFLNESGVRVLQRQILLQFASVGPGTALLEITTTCGTSDVDVIQSIVDSFEFAPASADSLLPDAKS